MKEQGSLSVLRTFLAGSYATLASRLVLGGVFLVAGATKIVDPGSLAASIRTYELGLPEWFVTFAAYSLPYLEVLLGLYLIAGLFMKASGWAAGALMFLFLIAFLQGAARGLEIDCGCFGPSAQEEATSLPWAIARNTGLLVLSLHIALAPIGRFSVDALLRRRNAGSAEGEAYEA